MAYIGNQYTNSFVSTDKQTITGDGGTSYTLSHAVANEQEIEVFVNNVRQEPGVAYTVSGTALTMTGDVEADDDFYVVFQGKAVQTSVPEDLTVSTAKIEDSAVTTAKINDDAVTTAKINDDAVTLAKISAITAVHSDGYIDIGDVRIQWLTATSPSSASSGASPGPGFTIGGVLTWPEDFKSGTTPIISAQILSNYHDVMGPGLIDDSNFDNNSFKYNFSCYRAEGLQSRPMHFIGIGEKP